MRNIGCDNCNEQKPLNDTVKIDEKVYCSQCIETTFPYKGMLDGKSIVAHHDPTVCHFCNKDFQDTELKKIAAYPVCTDCEKSIKNKTFPLWVKGFFAAIVVIICFSFFWNWKYYQAYNNIQDSFAYISKGDYSGAKKEMDNAAEKVPEVEDLQLLATYYGGVDLLKRDKCKEALIAFNKCRDRLPEDYGVENMIVSAKMGAAFDDKNYDEFLEGALANLANDSTSAESYTAVASAYACVYANKNDEQAKLNAYKYLKKAKAIDSTSAGSREYYNRVDYRITTRNIIDTDEFTKKFPQGWAKK